MDFQTVIVAIIMLIAVIYVSKIMLAKVKSFSAKSNCGNDCGCNANLAKEHTQIQRN